MKFSEKLTELRHSRGWSQEQLGELIMRELPETPGFIADMFSRMAEMMSR